MLKYFGIRSVGTWENLRENRRKIRYIDSEIGQESEGEREREGKGKKKMT